MDKNTGNGAGPEEIREVPAWESLETAETIGNKELPEELTLFEEEPFDEAEADEEPQAAGAAEEEPQAEPDVPAAAVPKEQTADPETQDPDGEPEEVGAPRRKKGVIILCVVLACIAALFGIYAYLCKKGETIDIDTQYTVNNINITGMSREEARAAIQKEFETSYADCAYQVDIEGKSFNIPVFPYLSIDASREIEKAVTYDRGPWLSRGLKYIQSKINAVEYNDSEVLPFLIDENGLLEAVEKVGEAVYVAPVDPTWSNEKDVVSVTAGITGRSIDPKEICDEIVKEIGQHKYSGSVSEDYILTDYKTFDIEDIVKEVHKDPVDATYSLENNEIVITKAKNGKKVKAEEIEKALAEAEEGTTVTVKKHNIKPKETAKHLEEILLADTLASYIVPMGGSWSQINNQTIASEAINGVIIMPGGVFSFNELVGDTTEEKGYVEDFAYENNRLVTQVGGGVCRVASTVYASILYTNLEVIERYNHTSPVQYLPYGMDATVSYPEPDLQFYNNRNYPVKVMIYPDDDGYLHSAIIGTREEGEPFVDVELDFETPMLVHTYRYFYSDENYSELLYTEFMHTSSYVELLPSVTPTPVPTPSPDQTQSPDQPTDPNQPENPDQPSPDQPVTPDQPAVPDQPVVPDEGGSSEGEIVIPDEMP